MAAVSIIVPLFNKERFILRALASIARQTWTDFEVLIVDDGSTDRGPERAAGFADPRFRMLRQSNAGPGAARNRGIEETSGELLAFLDADDEWLPGYLENGVGALHKNPAAAAATSAYYECPGERSSVALWERRGLVTGLHRITASTSPALLVSMLAFLSPCTTVSRRSVVQRWGGFYGRDRCLYAEDAFLWLKILLNEPVWFDLAPLTRIFRDASELGNLRSARPLEPFLQHPEEIQQHCPPELLPLLDAFFATRAFKTAAVWSYWGKWREGQALRYRFRMADDYRLPYFWRSLACSNPLGAAMCAVSRAVRWK